MKTSFPVGFALLLCVSLGAQAASAAQGKSWMDGTSVIQNQKARKGIRADAVAHQPVAARLSAQRTEAAPEIGELRSFWIVDFTTFSLTGELNLNEDKVQVWAELVEISPNAYLYVDVSVAPDPVLVDEMLNQFETVMYPTIGATFGTPPDALDGDPHVTILVSTFPGTDLTELAVAGYFDDANQYTDAEAMSMELGHSNEREMIYVNQDFLQEDPFTGELDVLLLGIFAHEYQHLVHWGLDRDEAIWLTEACSEYAMVLCGYGSATLQHLEMFSVIPTVSLTEWENRLETYGAVLYYMLYLDNHYGEDATISALANDPLNGDISVDNFLRLNYGVDFRSVFRDWSMTNMLCEVTGLYSYAFEETPLMWRQAYEMFGFHELMPVFFTVRFNSFTGALSETYLPNRTPEYYLFSRGAGESGSPFYGYIEVDGVWDLVVTYVGLNRTGTEDPYFYTRKHEFPVQLNTAGYGEFQIPTDDNYFALVLCNLTSHADPATGSINMTYRLGTLPGFASAIVDDQTAPAAVGDLAVADIDGDRVTLNWTAPGDDGTTGHAALYDLRYSTDSASLTTAFDQAPRVPTVAFPGYPGSTEEALCAGLPASSTLYFQLRTEDDRGNASFSNIASSETGAPVIACDATSVSAAAEAGTPPAAQALTIWNGGTGTLGYILETSPDWLTATPEFGFSDGPSSPVEHVIQFQTALLEPGDYAATITIVDPFAINSPATVPVSLTVHGSPAIEITWPSAGSTWQCGMQENLTFTCSRFAAPGELYVYLFRGETYLMSFGRVPFQNGENAAPIRLPGNLAPGSDYWFRLLWSEGLTVNASSEHFTVTASPSVAITWPTGGSTWQSGMREDLTFTCSGFPGSGEMYVYLFRGGTYLGSLDRVPFQNGENTAQILLPGGLAPGSDYWVRLLWAQSLTVNAASENFTVAAAPAIAVTWPTAGSTWQSGTREDLTFTCSGFPGPGKMHVLLFRGETYIRSFGRVSFQNGDNAVSIRLPGKLAPGSDYWFRVLWADSLTVNAASANFTVTASPTIDITWPTAGSSWQSGTQEDLTFTCSGFPAAGEMIVYLIRGSTVAANLGRIAFHNGANKEPILLPPGLAPGSDYWIRLLWAESLTVNGSSANFTVF